MGQLQRAIGFAVHPVGWTSNLSPPAPDVLALRALPEPEIAFHHLGEELDSFDSRDAPFRLVTGNESDRAQAAMVQRFPLSIGIGVRDGAVRVSILYSACYSPGCIDRLVTVIVDVIREGGSSPGWLNGSASE